MSTAITENNSRHSDSPTPHWTRQFWPWFLILLPASAVVASMFTITLAVQNAPIITDHDIGRFARDSASSLPAASTTESSQKQQNTISD